MLDLKSPWAPYLKEFYEYKQSCGYKYNSAESVIKQFDKYYDSLNIEELKLTRDVIEPFLYLEEGIKITTQRWKASVIRQFTIYVLKNNIIDHAYKIQKISLRGEDSFVPYIYSKDELIKIVEYISNYKTDKFGIFSLNLNTINSVLTVFKVLISTGLRLNETLSLRVDDVDLENKLFIIKEAKNNNERIVPFSTTLKDEILKYIGATPFKINYDDFLFQFKYGKKVSRSMCNVYFRKALKSIGLTKGPRIHDFRHTYAVMALTQLQHSEDNINLSLTYLSDYLGHKSLKETQKYIWITSDLFNDAKDKMNEYTSFIKTIYDGEKYYD